MPLEWSTPGTGWNASPVSGIPNRGRNQLDKVEIVQDVDKGIMLRDVIDFVFLDYGEALAQSG